MGIDREMSFALHILHNLRSASQIWQQLEHFREQLDQTHENFDLTGETIKTAAKLKREHAEQLEKLVERLDDMNQHDDNSTSFLMRLQEAIHNEAEMTRDTLAEGLSVMGEDVKQHRAKSLSAVQTLQTKYANVNDKKALCKQLEVIYADDMKFMSDLAGRYLRVQENFHQGIVTAECYGGKFTIFVQPDLVCGRLSWGVNLSSTQYCWISAPLPRMFLYNNGFS